MLISAGTQGVISVSGRDRRGWWRLVGVAVVITVGLLPVAMIVLLLVNAVTWERWGSLADPPMWLGVLFLTVSAVLASVPGAAVGVAAGLRRWWLVLAMAMSALPAVGALMLYEALAPDAFPLAVPVGMVAGSLLAVALADRLSGTPVDPLVPAP